MRGQRSIFVFWLSVLFLTIQSSAFAGQAVWSNSSGGDWNNPANWNTGQVPGPQDTVLITLAGSYDVVVQQAVTVAHLTLGGAGSQPKLVIQANPTYGSASLTVTQVLQNHATIILSSVSAKSFYDSRLILEGARLISTNNSVLKIAAGTFQQGDRVVDLRSGARWENGGRVEVLEYGAEFVFADTTARIINTGVIAVDTSRVLTLRGGVFELASGVIDGTVHMRSMGIAAGSLSPGGHLLFLGSSNFTGGPIDNRGVLEIRASEDFGDGRLVLTHPLQNRGVVRFNSTSSRSFHDAVLEMRADSLMNADTARVESLPGPFSAGERRMELQSGVRLENRGRMQLSYSLTVSMADTTADFRNRGTVSIDTSAVLTIDGGRFRPGTGGLTGAVSILSSTIQDGRFPDGALVTLEWNNVVRGQLENFGRLNFHGINTIAGTLINQASGNMVVEATDDRGDAVLKIENELQNHGRLSLSSRSDRSFHDARIEVNAGRIRNFAGGVVETLAGDFGAGARELQLAAGTRWENSGTVLVLQYDLSATLDDTSAKIINTGTIRVDSLRAFSLDGGRLELQNGVIDGPLQLTAMHIGPGVLSPQGRLVLTRLRNVIDSPVTNQGVLELRATQANGDARLDVLAEVENQGRVELTSSSDRSFHDAILRIEGATVRNTPSGTLAALPGDFAEGERRIELAGGGRLLNEGQVLIRQQAVLNQADSVTTINRGTFDIAGGQTLTVTDGVFENAGLLSGGGTLDVTGAGFVNSGTIQPGASPGRLTIDGDFQQTAGGFLTIEIGGRAAGTKHDALTVTGTAALDGTLQVQWINGFFPADADSFRVLDYGARIGTFAQIAGANLGGGQQLHPQYQPDHLTLVYQKTGNRAPLAQNDAAVTPEDEPVRIALLRNDFDPDGDPIRLVALDTTQTAGRVRADAGDTSVTYIPPPDFNGEDRFEYRIADVYGAEAVATVTITVTPVNDPPRIVSIPPAVAYVNSLFEYPVNATDPDGDAVTFAVVSGPAWLGFAAGGNVLRGTPTPADAGEVSVTIEARDPSGASGRQTFVLTVVNRADLANLVVSQIQVPPQAFSGKTIEIEWAVTNIGNQSTDAPSWWDKVYFSDDATFDPDTDTRITSMRNPAFLLPGDSYRNRVAFDLPPGADGEYTVFVVTDADDDLIEADENNNRAAATVQVTLSPMPDLRVTVFQAPPHAFSGDTIDVSWTVQNFGNGATPVDVWYDAFYLSEDSTLDYTLLRKGRILIDDRFLGKAEHTGILQPGESYQASARVVLPRDLFGQMHLFVFADSRAWPRGDERGEVYEHANEFNNTARTAIDITLTPPPDLAVTSVLHDSSGRSGELLYVEWTVENQGASRTVERSWIDRIWLSSSPTFHPDSAQILGDVQHGGELEAGDSYVANGQVFLPNGIAGSFYIIIQTDAAGGVFEHTFEDNNTLVSPTPLRVALSPWPDLVAEPVSAPDSAAAGEPIAVAWRVRNRGTGATRAPFFFTRLYLTKDSTWSAAGRQLAEVRHDGALAPAGESPQQVTVKLPANLEGTYYLFAVADVGDLVYEHVDENNNVSRIGRIFVKPYPPVNLRVEQVTAPASGQSGRPITLAWTVRNTGTVATRANQWRDAVYLSADQQFDPGFDRLVATLPRELPLPGGEAYQRQVQVPLPNGLSGDYYVIVVADQEQRVQDNNRADNALAASAPIRITLSPSPDLRIDSLTTATQAFAGQPVTLEVWLSNGGAAVPAEAVWYDAIYLSEDQALDDGDLRLATLERRGPVPSGSTLTDQPTVELPNYLSGDYFLLYRTDSRDDVYEHQAENNNVLSLPIRIDFMPVADLVVSAIEVPDSATPGQEITVRWTVRNQGQNPVAASIRSAAYVSADTLWQVSDPLVGVRTHRIDLPPGASTQMRMKVNLAARLNADSTAALKRKLPGLAIGDYHIIVRTDVRNVIREEDESNNIGVSSGRVHVSVPKLTLNTPVQDSLRRSEERYYVFEAPNGEDVQVRLQGAAGFFELYVRHGSTPDRSRYDFAGGAPFSAQQDVFISPTQTGQYYVLVRAENLPSGKANFTIEVKTWQFSLLSVEDSPVGDAGQFTLAVHGARLKADTRVFLQRGGSRFEAMRTEFIDGSQIIALFDADPLQPGEWDVVARQADGAEAVLPQAVTVEPALPPGLQVDLIIPPAVRVNQRVPIEIQATNLSNVNMERALVWMEMRPEVEMQWVDDFADVDSLSENNGPYLSPEGDRKVQMLFFANIGPRQTKRVHGWLELTEVGRYEFRIETYVTGAEEHSSVIAATLAEAVRQGWISTISTQTTPPLGKVLKHDCSALKDMGPALYKLCLQDNNRKEKVKDLQGIAEAGAKIAGTSFKPKKPGPIGATYGVGKFAYEVYKTNEKWEKMDQEVAEAVQAVDPNDIVGPDGYGDEHWVSAFRPLEYTVRFENDPEFATAPAQEVRIELPLDSTLDVRSFRLGPFGFGNLLFDVPQNVSFYRTRLDARDSLGVFVDLSAGIDVIQRKAFWYFRSIDPATGNVPSDPLTGMLPVNDATRRGEGFVRFRVQAGATAQTGDSVRAQARIVFDANDPIDTPEIFHTLDADRPTSRLEAVPAQVEQREVELRWQASDIGAGVKQTSLYLSTDGGPYQLLAGGLTGGTYRFTGEPGRVYRMFVLAEDQVGNGEPIKTDAEVTFQLGVTSVSGRTLPKTFRLYANYPNPFNPSTTIRFDVPKEARVEIRIFNVLGQEVRRLADQPFAAGTHTLLWDGRSNHGLQVGSGVYFILMKTESFTAVRKMTLLR